MLICIKKLVFKSTIMSKGRLLQALQLSGDNQLYQKSLIALISILWLSVNCIMVGQSYIYIDPVFTCLSTGNRQISEKQACKTIKQCTMIYPQTITEHLQLYCNRQSERVAIQSAYAVGSFLGLVLMNFLSDVKGRKFSTAISIGFMIAGTIIQILGGMYNLTTLLIFSQIVNGFGSYSLITLSYILLSDFCSSKYRQVGSILINSAWGFSTVLLGYLYTININWLIFLIWVVEVPLIITAIAIYFILIQSPFILIRRNKRKECLQSFAKICRFNKTENNLKQIQTIVATENICLENQQSFRLVLNIVKKKQNLKPILLLTTLHSSIIIYYYGVAYAMSQQGSGFGINMIIAGAVQTISYFVLTIFVTKMKRVKGLAISNAIASIVSLLFLISTFHENYLISSTILGVSRFFETISYSLLACMQVETFSIQIQSTAAGSVQALSMIGVLLSPVVVDLANKISIDPVVMISVIVLAIGIWPAFMLRETLPQLNNKSGQQLQSKEIDEDFLNPEQKQITVESIIENDSFIG